MKIDYTPDHPVTNAAAKAACGKDLDAWFKELDGLGGPTLGRKALNDYLFKEKKLDPWWATTIAVEYEKSRGALEKDGQPRGYAICSTKTIAAIPQQVYDSFLKMAWLGAGARSDVKEGGSFQDSNGHKGVFKKLAPGKAIKFTWGGEGHSSAETVEVKLTASGAKTSVVLNHERLPDRPAADGMRAAWAKVLNAAKESCE